MMLTSAEDEVEHDKIFQFYSNDVHFLARMKQPVRSFSTRISKLENRWSFCLP